jgi:hypothetical protein
MDPVVWENGPHEAGLAYHKVATYQAGGFKLKIDVSVAPGGRTCPVWITARSSAAPLPQRVPLNDPNVAEMHLTAIYESLRLLGAASDVAAYCAADVVAAIKREGGSINATQRELESAEG